MAAQRYQRVAVSTDTLTEMMQQGAEAHTRCIQGLPPGVTFIRAVVEYRDFSQNAPATLWLIYEHPDWPAVPAGQLFPELTPVFKMLDSKHQGTDPLT